MRSDERKKQLKNDNAKIIPEFDYYHHLSSKTMPKLCQLKSEKGCYKILSPLTHQSIFRMELLKPIKKEPFSNCINAVFFTFRF